MTTNAPYYQLGGGQFTNPTNASYVPDHLVVGNYDLAASAPVTPPNDAQAATNTAKHLYREHLKRPQQIASPVASLEADTHYFVDLLEAATTAAAGQARMVESTLAHTDGTESMGVAKRKRLSSSPPAENAATADTASEPKRARVDHLTNTQLQAKESDASDRSASGSVPPSSESLLNDARAAGVHSAAALFRRSSEKTNRKYTRPPMSKLFLSLQLTPENFLHLQAHAKAYMLDPAHPDRQSCVGNRGKGDTDMVKLRLFNCVRDFLQHGVGEQYFGEQSEKPRETDTMEVARALGQEKMTNEDKLVWPRDANKIISLVTPLLRRMVTNERQRMYAIETRKGGSKRKEATPTADDKQGVHDTYIPGRNIQPLRNTFQSPCPLPLTPAQVQGQHLYPPSPSSPVLPLPQSAGGDPAKTTHYAQLKPSIEMFAGEKFNLPTERSTDLFLGKINIFVTKNGHILRAERRFTDSPPAPLFHMTWQELNIRVLELVRETVSLYTDLNEEAERSANRAPEALRGLAVAAIQNQNHETVETSANGESAARADSCIVPIAVNARSASELSPTSSPRDSEPSKKSLMSPSSVLSSASLPEYTIGSQVSKGWMEITNEDDWSVVKNDAATAVWADKVCCVVTTLLP